MLKQSTARNFEVLMIDSSDHITGKSGLTLTITVSKDGGAFATITPVVTDLGTGWYNLALTTTHTNTLGDLCLHVTGTLADPTDVRDQVVVDLPGATVASVTGSVTVGSNTDKTGYSIAGTKTTLDALNDISSATVLTQVNTAFDAAGTELASVPSTTGSIRQKLGFLFQYFRNKRTVTASVETAFKEDAVTTLGTAAVSDDGTTFTHGEMG
jgi:hypothetical protein